MPRLETGAAFLLMKKKCLIVGGGTAGWMAALMLQKNFGDDWVIELIESSKTGIIGVGEGSTPLLKTFFDGLGIEEKLWMPACNATYKAGIRFEGWSARPGFESYFHPFYSHFDRDNAKALIYNSHLRRAGKNVHAHPDVFSYNHYLASARLAPVTPHHFPFEVQYGYHFDAALLAEFLKQQAIARGVIHRVAHIVDVSLSDAGEIASVLDDNGQQYRADWFFDCSGFAALLIGAALKTPFVSYADTLWNDRAVTLAMPADNCPPTETLSCALTHGWAWRIPLQSRVGVGYVYSSRYVTPEAAEQELRRYAGVPDTVAVKHLSMTVGRRQQHWRGNCVAVGLSQGFIEPLEATSLALTHQTLTRFINAITHGHVNQSERSRFNDAVNKSYDDVRDYISLHFLTNGREDSAYWIDNREKPGPVSDNVKRAFACWFDNGDLPALLKHLNIDGAYSANSWHYLLAGMGLFPASETLTAPDPVELKDIRPEQIREFLERCSLNHLDHQQALRFKGQKTLQSEHR